MHFFSRYSKYIGIPLLSLLVIGLAVLGTARLATHAAGTSSSKPSVTCGAWSTIASSNATTTTDNVLNAIAVVSAKNVWSVGYYVDPNTGFKQALTEQWNGTGWTVFPGATLATNNVLTGLVVIPKTTRLWAVGYTTDPISGLSQTLTERWNGTTWNVVASANVGTGNNYLTSITTVTQNNIWAAGYYVDSTTGFNQTLIEHWNGTAWSVVASANPGKASNVLTSISAHAANKIWVAGYFTNSSTGFDHTLTERYLNQTWQVVASPNGDAGNSILTTIANVPGLDQMWAVGSDIRNSAPHTLIEHWDGRTWAILASPSPTGATSVSLTGLAPLSLNSVWAVGYYVDGTSGLSQTLSMHWDGTAWTTVASLNPGTGNNAFYATDRVPQVTKIWAVGSNSATGASEQSLTESYC